MDYTDDEIRKLLDEATPGPWHREYASKAPVGEEWGEVVCRQHPAGGAGTPVPGMRLTFERRRVGRVADANAALVAAAPTLARLLLSARAEHRQAVDDIYTVLDDRDHYRDEATRLAAELAAVREALDAAGAPLTVERGGSGPDSGDEVEATTVDRVRWLADGAQESP